MATPTETKKPFIDLSNPENEKFTLIHGWCFSCKRKTDLLKIVGKCYICIVVSLAAGKIDVRTPPGYAKGPDECVVCLQPIRTEQYQISCLHCVGRYHRECAIEWVKSSGKKECPTCRASWSQAGRN